MASTAASRCFPRLYAAASLKRFTVALTDESLERFSAALCCGLIEAFSHCMTRLISCAVFRGFMLRPHCSIKSCGSPSMTSQGFPRLYAAASLKRPGPWWWSVGLEPFSAALCCGLIEARYEGEFRDGVRQFSAALCCGLIEAHGFAARDSVAPPRFPRLYAAASLKRRWGDACHLQSVAFSAALCCGLIEATPRVSCCCSC